MVKRKVTKESKRRLIIFGGLSVVVISYFIFSAFSMLLNIKNLSLEQQTLQNNLTKLQEDETNLTKELSKLKNDEYKARYAREYFLYSKESGEYIFANILDQEEIVEEREEEPTNLYNYVIATIIIVLLFIILFILKRIRKMNKKNE
ncbi:MAG: hypothetical protein HFI87_01255 [Bacilli bacterium]|nr:hypothetical protein [Bacilli bacterium]